jgi:hypothetical protein
MRWKFMLPTVFLVASLLASAAKEETLEQLKARADSAKPDERPSLCIEVAERQLKAADENFTEGNLQTAHAAINDVVAYSEKASNAAIETGKKMKNTEIALRKMAEKLRDIKRTLNFDDQGPVQAAADHLESLRTDLLSHMFGKGGK